MVTFIKFDDLTITIHLTTTQNRVYFGSFSSECSGGYREGETPGPIPNPEAKTLIAHNTASFRCGNVGRRLASEYQSQSLFFLQSTINFLSIITINNHTFLLLQHNHKLEINPKPLLLSIILCTCNRTFIKQPLLSSNRLYAFPLGEWERGLTRLIPPCPLCFVTI